MIRVEASSPQRFAQDDDGRLAGLIFWRREGSAECRCDAENRKNVCGDDLAIEPLGLAVAGQVNVVRTEGADLFKRLILVLEIVKVGGSCLVLMYADAQRLLPDRHESSGIFERQRPQQNRINGTEDR